MGLKSKNMTRGGLQVRMTVFVTSAVLLVSSVVLMIIAGWSRRDYEKILQDRLSDDLTAVARIMEQRLKRVEGTTDTFAAIASRVLADKGEMDSVLFHGIEVMDDVWALSIVLDKGVVPSVAGFFERGAYHDENGIVQFVEFDNGDELYDDPDWNSCFVNGKPCWGEAPTESINGNKIIGYYAPLNDKDGHRIGMVYSVVLEKDFTSFVTEYKVRKDIDISIYKPDGTMVVAPDEYILKLSPEDKLVRESVIDHIGWNVVLSADRDIINRNVHKAMFVLFLLFVLMYIVIFLAVRSTVRYVATPFIEEQRRIGKEKAVMENEMKLAAGAQNELVPHVFPPFPDREGLELSACLYPARDVGGDLYDYFICSEKLYFCIGDVSGKGVQAALFMAATHYLFRSTASEMPLAEAARHMNVSLCADNGQCRFVTFWMGCLDLRSGTLEYVNAGHDAPLLVRGGKVEAFPASENMPLGVWEEEAYVSGTASLMPEDMLLLFTDGVTEAMDADWHEFGRERLLDVAGSVIGKDASGLVESVLDSVRRHSLGTDQSDDITMLCLKFIKKETKV